MSFHARDYSVASNRSLMCSRPVVSLAIAIIVVPVLSVPRTVHTRLFVCKQPVADVQQARHFSSPCLYSFLSLIVKMFFNSNSQWLKHSSGRFHTRLFGCKQPVADVQQARRIFSHRLFECSIEYHLHVISRTRLLGCEQPVADVQQARRIFSHRHNCRSSVKCSSHCPHATTRLQAVSRLCAASPSYL